ncbi:hypothetical protein M5689_023085 [Euphorbia peplus]|nr:hypothetical protein M5689_023085 [Euphorbia peplus]
MGCCCSCRRTTSNLSDNIRVVDINGYVQDFDYPIIVRQLTAKKLTRSTTRSRTDYIYNHNNSAQLFVSTAEKLLSSTGSKQLGPETQLHPGNVYFLLPFSTLSDSFTPMDYVGLVTKLKAVSKTAPKNCIYDLNNSVIINVGHNNNNSLNGLVRQQTPKRPSRRYGRNRTWKPILATIRERSFNRRSESDLLRQSEDDIDQTEDLID